MSELLNWLSHPARTAPKRVALEIGGASITYAELHARAETAAAWLRTLGVRRSSVVATLLSNGAPFVDLVHATAACGAALLPLNTRATVRELTPQLQSAGAGVLIHDGGPLSETAIASAHGAGTIPVAFSDTPAEANALRFRTPPTAPRAAAGTLAIVFTSGTSGTPKGAMLSHENFRSSARASGAHLGAGSSDRWLACMPLFHVGGLSILLRAALYRSTVVLHEGFDPAAVNEALDRDGITCASLVPTMLARVLEDRGDRPAPKSLRFILLGGGPAPASLLARARVQEFPIAPTYGLTEAASQVATRLPDAGAGGTIDGLRPLPGTDVRLVDEEGHTVASGSPGEILVRSPSVMQGYISRPAETEAVLRGGWLHTGDFGVKADDETLAILDRRSDLILSGGENVYPAEVEAVLAEHPAVAEAAVAPLIDADWGQRPAAWLIFRAGPRPDADALRDFCRERLAGYKVPVAYHGVTVLPRTPSGKLQRRLLMAPIDEA